MKNKKTLTEKISSFYLESRTVHCLRATGIYTIGDLVKVTKDHLMQFDHIAIKHVIDAEAMLKKHGLKFAKEKKRVWYKLW